HASGSIPCSPTRVGRFLIVPENHEVGESCWSVFTLEDEGAKVVPVSATADAREAPGARRTWSPPAAQGARVWGLGDRGGLAALWIGEGKVPLAAIAKIAADLQTSGPAFVRARSEREAWVASGRSGRFDLNAERGTIAPAWTLLDASPALAPIQVA